MRWVFPETGLEQFELSIPYSPNTCVVILTVSDYSHRLIGSEIAEAGRMKPLRKNAFSSGRYAVHLAQNELGLAPSEILAEGRRPIWPSGQVGAITHSNDFAAAIVSCDLLSVGLDIERLGRIKEKLYHKFFTAAELTLISQMPGSEVESILFSGKESVYKAIYFIVQRYVNFQEVELVLKPENSSLSLNNIAKNMATNKTIKKNAKKYATTIRKNNQKYKEIEDPYRGYRQIRKAMLNTGIYV